MSLARRAGALLARRLAPLDAASARAAAPRSIGESAPASAASARVLSALAASSRPAPGAGAPRRGVAGLSPLDTYDLIPDEDGALRVNSVTDDGFVVGDTFVSGSILVAGDLILKWDAERLADVDLPRLAILKALRPPPDLLVLGTGRRVRVPSPEFRRALDAIGVGVEFLDTHNAVSTYNLLSQDGRKVVGAFLVQGNEQ